MSFGKNLKRLRKEKGISQEELSKSLGLKSRTMITSYENDKTMPKLEVVQRMAELFNVSLEELVGKAKTDDYAEEIYDGYKIYLTAKEKQEIEDYAVYLMEKRTNTKIEVLHVYKADNGDTFFEHNNQKYFRSINEIRYLMDKTLVQFMEQHNPIPCKAVRKEIAPNTFLMEYYNPDNELIGTAGINITKDFYSLQNFIFIRRQSSPDFIEQIVDAGRGSYITI